MYAVIDQHGRELFKGTLEEVDSFAINIYKTQGRDGYYKLSMRYIPV